MQGLQASEHFRQLSSYHFLLLQAANVASAHIKARIDLGQLIFLHAAVHLAWDLLLNSNAGIQEHVDGTVRCVPPTVAFVRRKWSMSRTPKTNASFLERPCHG